MTYRIRLPAVSPPAASDDPALQTTAIYAGVSNDYRKRLLIVSSTRDGHHREVRVRGEIIVFLLLNRAARQARTEGNSIGRQGRSRPHPAQKGHCQLEVVWTFC